MAKESSLTVKICDWIVKYSIFAVIFLTPLSFLPITADMLDFNKQAVLVFLTFIALFAWMLKVLVVGRFEINSSKINITLGVLFLVYFFANIFSINKYGSFWGWPQITSESLLTLIGLLVFYFFVSNIFSKKDISNSIFILSISAFLAQIYGIFQLLGLYIFPFDFAKSSAFNTIGSAGFLGFFAVILLPIAFSMLIVSKKWWKIFFALQIFLSAVILFLVNYPIVWWTVIVASAVILTFGIIKRDAFDGRWMALPMFFLAVSLFFVSVNPQIAWMTPKANEILLSQKASFNISLQAIKERPIFGSGPGTYSYDFLKFKDPSFSQSSLWSVTFNQGTSKVLNDLATTGVLGFFALLALMGFSIFYSIKFLLKPKEVGATDAQKESAKNNWIFMLGIYTALIAETVAFFLYNSNIVLNFIYFFAIAIIVSMVADKKKDYRLKSASLTTLVITFIFTLMLIFGLGLLIFDGQRYLAEVNHYSGLVSWQAGNKDAGTKQLEASANLNSSSDLYFKQLSQVYVLTLQDEFQKITATPSDAEKTRVQTLIANSINAAKIATDLNPKNAGNWSNRGYIYQSLYGLVNDSTTWALSSYEEALKLDPNDPYLLEQEGSVNYLLASALSLDKVSERSQYLNEAKEKLEKAIALNGSYSDALYTLGLVYDELGQKDKAIELFKKVQTLNPNDTNVPKILANLNAGLPALQAPDTSATPPTDESTIKNPETAKPTKK